MSKSDEFNNINRDGKILELLQINKHVVSGPTSPAQRVFEWLAGFRYHIVIIVIMLCCWGVLVTR